MKQLIVLFSLPVFLLSCMTPQKAYKQEDYQKAVTLASKRIDNKVRLETNLGVYKKAALQLAEARMIELNKYEALEDVSLLGELHLENEAIISEISKYSEFKYDKLVVALDKLNAHQTNIEHKISNISYDHGQTALAFYYKTNLKKHAREAYDHFTTTQKYNGQSLYPEIESLMEKSYAKGIVYYTSTEDIPPAKFLEVLPKDRKYEADCHFTIDKGEVIFKEDRKTTRDRITRNIRTGTKTVRDSSGRIIRRDETYRTYTARVLKTTVTLTASSNNWINAENLSGQCHIEDHNFSKEISDKYYETRVRGDRRALRYPHQDQYGEPPFLRERLIDKLNDKISAYTVSL